ncbi:MULTISPECIES: hypothetical protein [Tenacibaculum]|uniref:hypothetical protein n=1 Tax=Tenacibaculum TaxID=104267 RepID=UPI0006499EFD|nr:hypothetical protein [Tenacibaculum mesophilum]
MLKKKIEKTVFTNKKIQSTYFSKGLTKENFLDYVSSSSARISFWKWQWNVMFKEVKKYYSN